MARIRRRRDLSKDLPEPSLNEKRASVDESPAAGRRGRAVFNGDSTDDDGSESSRRRTAAAGRAQSHAGGGRRGAAGSVDRCRSRATPHRRISRGDRPLSFQQRRRRNGHQLRVDSLCRHAARQCVRDAPHRAGLEDHDSRRRRLPRERGKPPPVPEACRLFRNGLQRIRPRHGRGDQHQRRVPAPARVRRGALRRFVLHGRRTGLQPDDPAEGPDQPLAVGRGDVAGG